MVTCYNSKKYTYDIVKSIARQELRPFEVIVIDDCSSEPDIERLRNRIELLGITCKVYALEYNSGTPSIPRNIGVSHASGDCIAFLDQDDIWEASHLQDSIRMMDEDRVDIVSSGYYLFGDNGKRDRQFRPTYRRVTRDRLREVGNVVVLSSVVARREILQVYTFRDDYIWEDFELWYRIAEDSKVVFVTGSFINVGYRVSKGSRSDGIDKTLQGLREMKRYMNAIELLTSRWYVMMYVKVAIRSLVSRLSIG